MGRMVRENKKISGNPEMYSTAVEYDWSGKPTRTIYPDNTPVETTYYPGTSLVKEVHDANGTSYATFTDYRPEGKIGTAIYGKISLDEYATETEYLYSDLSGRLTSLKTLVGTLHQDETLHGETLQHNEYFYDNVGNIDRMFRWSREVEDSVEYRYRYDDLHRLDAEEKMGSPVGNPGTAIYQNLKNYYDGPSAHAVSFTENEGPAGVRNSYYEYDPNGNLNYKWNYDEYLSDPSNIKLIDYNAANMPTAIRIFDYNHDFNIIYNAHSTLFTYDAFGRRVAKHEFQDYLITDAGEFDESFDSTFYISNAFEVHQNQTATKTVKYLFAGNQRVAMITTDVTMPDSPVDEPVRYIHKDHLGSTTVVTLADGSLDSEEPDLTHYRPYGTPRFGSALSSKTDYNYTDQELDRSTGFYNYNARLFDPEIAMFITADTLIQNAYDPQFLNRYAYVRNNPIRYVDPSGHKKTKKETSQKPFTRIGQIIYYPGQSGFYIGGRWKGPGKGYYKSGPKDYGTHTHEAKIFGALGAAALWLENYTPIAPKSGPGRKRSMQRWNWESSKGRYKSPNYTDNVRVPSYHFPISFGISSEVSTIAGGRGGIYGANWQYTQDEGFKYYEYKTPDDSETSGFDVGVSTTANVGLGSGPWSGKFISSNGSLGMVTSGVYTSPDFDLNDKSDTGYMGFTFGATLGLPGLGVAETSYEEVEFSWSEVF